MREHRNGLIKTTEAPRFGWTVGDGGKAIIQGIARSIPARITIAPQAPGLYEISAGQADALIISERLKIGSF